jgi:hypothetical protein
VSDPARFNGGHNPPISHRRQNLRRQRQKGMSSLLTNNIKYLDRIRGSGRGDPKLSGL